MPKTQKRAQKNVVFFKRTEKDGPFRTEKNVVPNPEIKAFLVTNFSMISDIPDKISGVGVRIVPI